MKERPILFSTAMVQAILAGKKSQTRRVIKPQPTAGDSIMPLVAGWQVGQLRDSENAFRCLHCPYGNEGGQLWVREAFIALTFGDYRPIEESWRIKQNGCVISYAADKASGYKQAWDDYPGKWRPSIHLPRWASRIQLEVLKVRVERLQDISNTDILAEGLPPQPPEKDKGMRSHWQQRWDAINAKRGFGWDANPWVWVIEFKQVASAGASTARD